MNEPSLHDWNLERDSERAMLITETVDDRIHALNTSKLQQLLLHVCSNSYVIHPPRRPGPQQRQGGGPSFLWWIPAVSEWLQAAGFLRRTE